jgi:alkylation response protein AidB-like acyl-CoA dehydrogenase
MDFRLTPDQLALRAEARRWLRETLGSDWQGEDTDIVDTDWERALDFNRRLAGCGWLAPGWPRRYGGLELNPVEQLILTEELVYARAPAGGRLMSVGIVGSALLAHGTEEQRTRCLPAIARAEEQWCQGFSEPGAGSDLAALQTRAVRDADDYVISGEKIWTTNAHHADWMLLLARTDPNAPKHRGISAFLLDMTTPGISLRPLINMAMRYEFNQVFLDNVRVPASCRLGEENRGWYLAATTLDAERTAIAGMANGRRFLDDLIDCARELPDNGRPLIESPRVRRLLADLRIAVEVGRLLSYRIAALQARGLTSSVEASMAKLYAAQLAQYVAQTGMQILGPYGALSPGSRWTKLAGRFAVAYAWSVSQTYAGGSVEIQRGIIATRGLGLPRV